MRPRQNGCHFPDDTLKCIFLIENVWISIEISMRFFPKSTIDNIPTLVQIMALRRPGDKPWSEPMMFNLLTHICLTWSQWVNQDGLVIVAIYHDSLRQIKQNSFEKHIWALNFKDMSWLVFYGLNQHNAYRISSKRCAIWCLVDPGLCCCMIYTEMWHRVPLRRIDIYEYWIYSHYTSCVTYM